MRSIFTPIALITLIILTPVIGSFSSKADAGIIFNRNSDRDCANGRCSSGIFGRIREHRTEHHEMHEAKGMHKTTSPNAPNASNAPNTVGTTEKLYTFDEMLVLVERIIAVLNQHKATSTSNDTEDFTFTSYQPSDLSNQVLSETPERILIKY